MGLQKVAFKFLETNINCGFNKFGSKLVRCRKGIPVSEIVKTDIPRAVTVDFTTVESKFGATTTDILSFKDEYGNLVKRYRTTKHNGSNIVERMEGDYNIDKEYGFGKIKRKYSINDELTKEEKISIYTYGIISKKVTEFFERATKHIISRNYKGKFIELSALRQNDGLKGNKITSTLKSNCLSNEEREQLNNLTFLHEFDLSGKAFLDAITPTTVKAKKFKIFKPKISVAELEEGCFGKASFKDVKIDMTKHSLNEAIIDTINHELQHVKQNETMIVYNLETIFKTLGLKKTWKRFIEKNYGYFSKTKRNFAQKCITARKEYTASQKDYKAYYNNFLEVDARQAGDVAKKEYLRQQRLFGDIWYDDNKHFLTQN